MRTLSQFAHASPSSLAEATENYVAFLIAQGRASKPTPELRREVELHLWLDQLCDHPPGTRGQPNRKPRRSRSAS